MNGKVDFSGVRWGSVEWTNLCTLYLRAYESRLATPILDDHAAAEAVGRIDYDFARLDRAVKPWANQFLVALRAKQLDTWAEEFLGRHADAVVLHLGCGLDSRAFRIEVPSGVHWVDVDVPEVIALRRKLYTDRPGYTTIGSSVTDPGWLDQIPADRPALIVAEGLLMYLTEPQIRELLRRLTDRFGTGELLADLLSPWGPRFSNSPLLARAATSGITKWGTRDGHELPAWNPRLRLVDTRMFLDPAKIPLKPQRLVYRLLTAVPFIANYDRLYRFQF
ncbi:class I SAM-dependent methyltransferase [Mycobacterium cookii]|uniref:O-methyltransferase-like protein n=1 Tax=Mycobacterium cookii TaxID=1775 RepID=A0A7I7L0D9_9MYCO|nr:class I SAM-dependent methyltransferase [Mycobacterium cookii]MCV7330364.1 class I SAM-dependent methyltransferase [Mycobacterium cookii]BBX47449.1 O-methyltransferase-like protein [Mycobacterium cookii]